MVQDPYKNARVSQAQQGILMVPLELTSLSCDRSRKGRKGARLKLRTLKGERETYTKTNEG